MSLDPLKLAHPIVLVHGLGAQARFGPVDYYHGWPKRLRAAGNRVFVPNLTAWHTIESRAQQLKQALDAEFPDQRVNLIAHSMGGLDCRYLISALDHGERVASLTTIGTPHLGTRIADLALGLLPDKTLMLADRFLTYFESSSGAFKQLTTSYMQETFAQQTPNDPRVQYFSATSAIPDPIMKHALPVFWLSHGILKRLEGDNDGFVSVPSATWGTHILTDRGDHYAQIGQILGRSRGLNYVAFQDAIIMRLHKEGL